MKRLSMAIVGLLWLSVFSLIALKVTKAEEIFWNANPISLPKVCALQMSVVHDGKIYLIGGRNPVDIPTNDVYFANINYDGTVGSWSSTTSLPEIRAYGAVLVWNSFIYVIGGEGPVWDGLDEQNSVFYAKINPDGTIGNWMTTTPLPERIKALAAIVWNERIYVAGGWNGYVHKDEVYYTQINPDGSLSNWQTTIPLPTGTAVIGAVTHDGVIYLIGGVTAHKTPTSSVYYAPINADGTLGTWTSGPSLPEARAVVQPVLIGNDINIIGGYNVLQGSEIAEKTVYRADVKVLDWMEINQSLPEGRMYHSVVAFQGRIYVIGGDDVVSGQHIRKDTIFYSSLRHYLVVQTEPKGLTAIPGEGWYDECTNVELTAPAFVPSEEGDNSVRYRFDYWDIDREVVEDNPVIVHMDVNHTAIAHYILQYYLNVGTQPEPLNPAPAGEGWYDECTSVELLAPPTAYYADTKVMSFNYWMVDGAVVMGNPITIHMGAPHIAIAHYYIPAVIDIKPDALNLGSEDEWITVYIELPEDYNVTDINISTVMLNDTVPVDPPAPATIGDYDSDGISDLMIKFSREEVANYILSQVGTPPKFFTVTLTITGTLNGMPFEGSDTIKAIYSSRERLIE